MSINFCNQSEKTQKSGIIFQGKDKAIKAGQLVNY